MNYLSRLKEQGAPIGELGNLRSPALEWFIRKQVLTNPSTISRLRMEDTSGRDLLERVEAEKIIAQGICSGKDLLYFRVAHEGSEFNGKYRESLGKGFKRLSGNGFAESMADSLGFRVQPVRRALRAMRADVVSSQIENRIDKTEKQFREIAEKFFEEYSTVPESYKPMAAEKIEKAWIRSEGILGFYEKYYSLGLTPQGQKNWLPYEVEFLKEHYKERVRLGAGLTLFDRWILQSRVFSKSIEDLVGHCRAFTGIPVDNSVIFVHRNVLIHGVIR